MESDYYTPTIEEFHVGFESEIFAPEVVQWGRYVWKFDDDPVYFRKLSDEEAHRVKYLDKEDIESLGFEVEEETNNGHTWLLNFKVLDKEYEWDYDTVASYNINNKTLTIDNGNRWPDEYECLVTDIKIKNKSELKKILNQLGIDYERKQILD